MKGEKRLIDLLIVDEIHDYFTAEKDSEEIGERISSKDLDELNKSLVSFLAEINKKFCVLISATPIRTSLRNVSELVYIADKKRLGANKRIVNDLKKPDEKKITFDYFNRVICGIDDETDHGLARMIFSDTSFAKFNEELICNFFGFINNFFTRRRVRDVSADMMGCVNCTTKGLADELKRRLREPDVRRDFVENRAVMYRQTRRNLKSSYERSENMYADIVSGMDFDMAKSEMRHTKAALDATVIEQSNNLLRDVSARKDFHALADWRRRSKDGMAVNLSELMKDEPQDTVPAKVLLYILNLMLNYEESMSLKEALKYIQLDDNVNSDSEKKDFISKFAESVKNDARIF